MPDVALLHHLGPAAEDGLLHAAGEYQLLPVHYHVPLPGLHLAALTAPAEPPGLVVLQVLQLRVPDPGVLADPTLAVVGIAHVHGDHLVRRGLSVAAPQLRQLLPLVADVHAVHRFHPLLGGGQAEDDVVHVLQGGVDPLLGDHLLGVSGGHGHLPGGVVGSLPVVPLHVVKAATLDGDRPLLHVVDVLHGQPVQLVSEHVLDDLGQGLVLLPPGSDLGLGNVAGDLGLDQLRGDVAHMGRLLFSALRGVVFRQGTQHPIPQILLFPAVHLVELFLVGRLAVRQPLLPEPQLLALLFCLHRCHLNSIHGAGCPHLAIRYCLPPSSLLK